MACVPLLDHRDEPDVETTSDPLGEIRVFVYQQKSAASQVASAAVCSGPRGGGTDARERVELKHTVTGERFSNHC